MIIHDYKCKNGHTVEIIHEGKDLNVPRFCETCGEKLMRIFRKAPEYWSYNPNRPPTHHAQKVVDDYEREKKRSDKDKSSESLDKARHAARKARGENTLYFGTEKQ